MLLWSLAFVAFIQGLRWLVADAAGLRASFGSREELAGLTRVGRRLREIQEILESGSVPEPARWEELARLPNPWGALTTSSLQDLRQSGGSLLPTLRRLRALAERHAEALGEARAKAAQALAQALVCAALVPLWGGALYFLLPGVDEHPWLWLAACALAVCAALVGSAWLVRMAEAARWGGLAPEQRPWILGSLCAGEKLLAAVRAGVPADLAWQRACQFLALHAEPLAARWGFSIWESEEDKATLARAVAARPLLGAGAELKKAVQVALMEGRPCGDRVETALSALRSDLDIGVERELSLLATRAFQPLFFCVAPALMGLLGVGIYLAWTSSAGSWSG